MVPRPLTTAMIAIEIPAAIRPYSIAVAPLSFFKNAYGEIHGLSPWRLVDYWAGTRTPDPDDFVFG